MKTFVLDRLVDETGISGTGHVAEGVVFGNGKVAVGWQGLQGVPSVVVFDSVEDMEKIHGHNGLTKVVWT